MGHGSGDTVGASLCSVHFCNFPRLSVMSIDVRGKIMPPVPWSPVRSPRQQFCGDVLSIDAGKQETIISSIPLVLSVFPLLFRNGAPDEETES